MSKTSPKPDNYRLRMRYLQWYLDLCVGTETVEILGPFDFHTAAIEAEKLGLPDGDRG